MLKMRTLIIVQTLCLLSTSVHSNPSNKVSKSEDVCADAVQRIYKSHVYAPTPPNISGVWTSERCEVRPGPEYMVRKYRFTNDSKFEVIQFYYGDADCTDPIFSITAKGSFEIRGDFWTVPGGTEVDYQLTFVTVMPYTDYVAANLSARVKKVCPQHVKMPWKSFQRHDIYYYFVDESDTGEAYSILDRDCTHALDFSLHELQLMRLEERKHHLGSRRTLFLGDVHTDRKERPFYRPTSYQAPLVAADNIHCSVCHKVSGSEDIYPPHLHRRLHTQIDLTGEWFSEGCETRPNSMFLTRRIIFGVDNRTWEGYYYHYADGLCREPLFTIHAKGAFVAGKISNVVQYAYHFDFKVTEMLITPDDLYMAKTLNSRAAEGCGQEGSWKVGVELDVTPTKGCVPLGIKVPHVEYELLKVEREHKKYYLFLGQRPSDGSHPASSTNRPTSFQPPLLKCPGRTNFKPPVTPRKYKTKKNSAHALPTLSCTAALTSLLLLLYTWHN